MATLPKCEMIGHQMNISRICVFKECREFTRYACDNCIQEKIHQHGLENENHIKSQEEFRTQAKQQYHVKIKWQLEGFQYCIGKLNNIVQSIHLLISEIHSYINSISNQNQLITKLIRNILTLDKLQIDRLINFDKYGVQLNLQDTQCQLDHIISQCTDIQQILKQQNQDIKITIQDKLEFNYQEYFQWNDISCIQSLQISPNEQLIAYGGNNNKLTVMDLAYKLKVKEIKLNNILFSCRFSYDSLLICCGDDIGYLYVYDVNQGYKEIFKNKLHEQSIKDIKLINYQAITCSDDLSIMMTDIRNNIQLFKIDQAHSDQIYQIEYEPKKQIIISCSQDNSINVFFCKIRRMQIKQQNIHDEAPLQIQLANDNTLLSRSCRELKQWQINYQQRNLKLLRKFTESEDLYRFDTLNNNLIVKIYENYLKIIASNFKSISQHVHGIISFYSDLQSNQTKTMNYILILEQFKVLKRINEFE